MSIVGKFIKSKRSGSNHTYVSKHRKGLSVFAVVVILLIGLFAALPSSKFLPVLNGAALLSAKPKERIHVLFIGNSYTYFNNLPELVSELAVSAQESKLIDAKMITMGGVTLKQHWQKGDALNAIRQGGWNYVVLQEHSTLGPTATVNGTPLINDPTDFYKYARRFDAEIKKVGAKTIFFLTWARQNAPQNQQVLNKAYFSIAGDLDAAVAPVGIAWQKAMRFNPNLVLYQYDKSHPNSTGSYLTACVFYTMIYHHKPKDLTGHISGPLTDTNPLSTNPLNNDGNKTNNKTYTRNEGTLVSLDSVVAGGLQDIAWDAVSQIANPDAGATQPAKFPSTLSELTLPTPPPQ